MWIFTGKAVWLPLAFWSCWFWSIKRTGASHYWSCVAIVLVVTLCDQFASHVCKLSSPVSARLTILILWIRWKLFSDTGEDFTDLFPAMLRTPVSRLLWHWSCGISCSAGQSFSGRPTAYTRVYLGVHFISISCREPFRVCSSVIWSTGSILSAVRLLPAGE